MSAYRVVLSVENGLALGSILMTKGVTLIDIEKMNRPIGLVHEIIEHKPFNPNPTKQRFKHPSGKNTSDFILEFMSTFGEEIVTWKAIGTHLSELGFKKSTTNNAIERLIEQGKMEKIEYGKYKLVR